MTRNGDAATLSEVFALAVASSGLEVLPVVQFDRLVEVTNFISLAVTYGPRPLLGGALRSSGAVPRRLRRRPAIRPAWLGRRIGPAWPSTG